MKKIKSISFVCFLTAVFLSLPAAIAQTPSLANFQSNGFWLYGYTAATTSAASEISMQIAIDSAGRISGNGTIRSFKANRDVSTETTFTVLPTSKIALPIASTTPQVSTADGATETTAEHAVDCVIRTSNAMTLKGRLKYYFDKITDADGVSDGSVLGISLVATKRPSELGILSGEGTPANPL
jgi:hypothetical protein